MTLTRARATHKVSHGLVLASAAGLYKGDGDEMVAHPLCAIYPWVAPTTLWQKIPPQCDQITRQMEPVTEDLMDRHLARGC